MKVLVLDNYDSFTFNLVHLLRELGVADLEIHRNDKISLEEAGKFEKVVLSPGPGIPCEAGIMPELVKRYAAERSILGVCLGHQCIGEAFGASLINMPRPVHGTALPAKIVSPSEPIFRGLPSSFKAGRYHSWLVSGDAFPACLEVTAVDEKGDIMALSHREFDLKGVQFHPESVLTEHGKQIVRNWLEIGL